MQASLAIAADAMAFLVCARGEHRLDVACNRGIHFWRLRHEAPRGLRDTRSAERRWPEVSACMLLLARGLMKLPFHDQGEEVCAASMSAAMSFWSQRKTFQHSPAADMC